MRASCFHKNRKGFLKRKLMHKKNLPGSRDQDTQGMSLVEIKKKQISKGQPLNNDEAPCNSLRIRKALKLLVPHVCATARVSS